MTTRASLPEIAWTELVSGATDGLDGRPVEIVGWLRPVEEAGCRDYALLVPESLCCAGCVPGDRRTTVEVFFDQSVACPPGEVRVAGTFRRLDDDDPAGWRYQLRDAEVIASAPAASVFTRRTLLGAGPLLCLAAASPRAALAQADTRTAAGQVLAGALTIDIHSHAGRAIGRTNVPSNAPFTPVAAPMREGGMAVICLAMVADTPILELTPDRRIRTMREAEPGELYEWSRLSFARLTALVKQQDLHSVTDLASLTVAPARGPSVLIAAEGADFLEGRIERLEEAHREHRLRHLQLTHYRVNELGDIQTTAAVHGGLTGFGAEVIRHCNRMGIVVDVAHGTFDLVKRAAAVTAKPLVLSHTSLANRPRPYSRLISPDHARLVAGTGGVIGIWPPSEIFPDLAALAAGIARMVDTVGIDHVGLGTDMNGLTAPPTFSSYRQLPDLAASLMARGFHADEVRKLLGGNYARVFAATMASS